MKTRIKRNVLKSRHSKKNRKGKKGRKSKKKYKKQIGGSNGIYITTTNVDNADEIRFPEMDALINLGDASISTQELINCIAIGGEFIDIITEKPGTFLTHESPVNYKVLKTKLTHIKKILTESNKRITKIVVFCIDKPSRTKHRPEDRYSPISEYYDPMDDVVNNTQMLDTASINEIMITFSEKLFDIVPIVINYTDEKGGFKHGKVIMRPGHHEALLVYSQNIPELSNRRYDFYESF